MYLKINKKKIDLETYLDFEDRFKSLKFAVEKLDYAIRIPNKKIFNTYFFLQKVDVVVTDKDNVILDIYPSLKSEKFVFTFKGSCFYILPRGYAKYLKVGDELRIEKEIGE